MKKLTALFIVFVLCMSCLSVMAAPPISPSALLSVSTQDAEGNITLTLEVGGVYYQGVQASVYYNPEELPIRAEHLKNITVGEPMGDKNSLNLVQAELHEESHCIAVTAIMNLSLMDDEIYYLSSMEKMMTVFSLKVPATTEKPNVGFALKESHVYDKGNPDGLVISYDGVSQSADTGVRYWDGTTGQTGKVSAPEPTKTPEQLRAERILNTAILQQDNYAAVKNGALCYVDETNKAVMPFMYENEMYVPFRFLAEAFGHSVGFDDASQTPLLNEKMLEEPFVVINARTFISVASAENLLNIKGAPMGDVVIFTKADNPWNGEGAVEQGILSDALFIMSPAIRDMK